MTAWPMDILETPLIHHQERRNLAHLLLEVLVRIRDSGVDRALAETRNVSARGLYLHSWQIASGK